MTCKLFLILLLIPLIPEDFPTIKGNFKKRGGNFDYTSAVEFRDNRYYIKTNLKCDIRDEFCLSWPGTGILCHNIDRFKMETSKTIEVKYPQHTGIATIYFGAGLRDEVTDIECYRDEDSLYTTANNYDTKLSFVNEIGRAMNVVVSSTYVPQIESTTLEVELKGGSAILIEKSKNLALQDSSKIKDWEISTVKDIDQVFDEGKYNKQISEFLQLENNEKSYFYCIKKATIASSKIKFISSGAGYITNEASFFLLSENKKQNIGFTAKVFLSK